MNKHKKAIVAVSVVAGGVVVYAITKKSLPKIAQKIDVNGPAVNWEELRKKRISELAPNWSTGELTEIWESVDDGAGSEIEIIVNNLKPEDLGKFGEDILKLDGTTNEDSISLIGYVFKPSKE